MYNGHSSTFVTFNLHAHTHTHKTINHDKNKTLCFATKNVQHWLKYIFAYRSSLHYALILYKIRYLFEAIWTKYNPLASYETVGTKHNKIHCRYFILRSPMEMSLTSIEHKVWLERKFTNLFLLYITSNKFRKVVFFILFIKLGRWI